MTKEEAKRILIKARENSAWILMARMITLDQLKDILLDMLEEQND